MLEKVTKQLLDQEKREQYLLESLKSLSDGDLGKNPYVRISLLEKSLESVLERLERVENGIKYQEEKSA